MSAEVEQMPVTKHGVHTLCFRSLKRTHDTFISDHGCMPEAGKEKVTLRIDKLKILEDKTAEEMKKAIKTKQEYGGLEKSQPKAAKIPGRALAIEGEKTLAITDGKSLVGDGDVAKQNRTENVPTPIARPNQHGAIVPGNFDQFFRSFSIYLISSFCDQETVKSDKDKQEEKMKIAQRKAPVMPKPKWHAPWKLYRVISGHIGWVRCVDFEPGNEWFVTGSNDR